MFGKAFSGTLGSGCGCVAFIFLAVVVLTLINALWERYK